MITAVDSNVLIDVFGGHGRFGPASAAALRSAQREGALVACDIVWAETVGRFASAASGSQAMGTLRVDYSPTELATAVAAAGAWNAYRRAGGGRDRLIADFLVGAHAAAQADRLLTRDRGVFSRYFPELTILDPTA